MSTRDSYPANVPSWVDTTQPDVDAATAFYADLFGWALDGPGPMDRGGRYYVAKLHGAEVAGVASLPPGAPGATWNTYVSTDDVDAAVARALAAGGSVVTPAFDASPAGRIAMLADPDGAVFGVWRPEARIGAERVNEPGAWAMSSVRSADPQRAAGFYGEVFGWTTEAFGPAVLLRLPGYVGGEPRQPVSREVVAAALPAPGPARWAVDFWVGDADATAARATGRGAEIVGAHDQPMRSVLLRDPQGAELSVTTAPGAP